MTNLFFYLPLTYRYHTRERKRFLIPFLLTDFLPVFVLTLVLNNCITFDFIICFLLAFFAMFTIYEIGYIINDTITVKTEVNPVLRLTQIELDYFYSKELFVFGIRLLFFLACCISLLFITQKNMSFFIVCNIGLLTTYFFHNYYRNNIRFITNTVLNIEKYFIPLIAFDFQYSLIPIMSYFFFFPFFRSINYILEKKTKINIYVFQIFFVSSFLVYLILLSFFTRLTILEYSFYVIFSMYKFAVCLLQVKRGKKK